MRIVIEQGRTGLFYATSTDIKGLLVAGATLEEVAVAIPGAVAALERARSEARLHNKSE